MRRRWIVWLLVFSGWTALAIFFAASSSLTYALTYQPPQWRLTLVMALTEWYAWAVLTPLVAWLARRFPLRSGSMVAGIAVHTPAGLIVALVKVTLTRLLRLAFVGTNAYFQISNLATHYVIYWALVAAVHALAYYRAGREGELRASQLEARLADARLQLLKMQLHPHFLFNTLNTISELVHEDPLTADRMIASLSDLLRESLDAGAGDRVPLAKELQLLDRYVDIQRARFGDRLDVRVDVEDEARDALVPILILQPIVENSIRHGLAARVRAETIQVRAMRFDDRLILEVADDGIGLGAGRRGTRRRGPWQCARAPGGTLRPRPVDRRQQCRGRRCSRSPGHAVAIRPRRGCGWMTLRLLIVDDEPVARRRLRRLVREIGDIEIAGEAGDGDSAVSAIRTLKPDIVLLDVQMPGNGRVRRSQGDWKRDPASCHFRDRVRSSTRCGHSKCTRSIFCSSP